VVSRATAVLGDITWFPDIYSSIFDCERVTPMIRSRRGGGFTVPSDEEGDDCDDNDDEYGE
jgi:hypothetical protein